VVAEVGGHIAAARGRTVQSKLRIARLLAGHGPALPGPDLRRILAADCPRMIEGKMHDTCGVHFPGTVDAVSVTRAS
jgi:hypothetical protein